MSDSETSRHRHRFSRLRAVIVAAPLCLGAFSLLAAAPGGSSDLQRTFDELERPTISAGLIFITQEAFLTRASSKIDDESARLSSVTARGINARVAHEVAHAWFPHVSKVVRSAWPVNPCWRSRWSSRP